MRILHVLSALALIPSLQGAAATPNVRGWGLNPEGQLNVPPHLTNAVLIACGRFHNLAVRDSGHVVAWGANYHGQCDVPPALTNAIGIAAGENHSVAVTADGNVIVWGSNLDHQREVPPNVTNAIAVAAGSYHSLALKSDGTVVAWGINADQQCDVPLGLTNVVAIAATYSHSVALHADGTATSWGLVGPSIELVDFVKSLNSVTAISGRHVNLVAINSDSQVLAGGDNAYGENIVPENLSNAVAVAAGELYNMALNADRTVVVWGKNLEGLCNVPVDLPPVLAISGGAVHCLALLSADAVPRILAPPRSQTATVGSSVRLTVGSVGPPPLTYQWFFSNNPISGATNSVLSLFNLQTSQSGEYKVVVSNVNGSVVSQSASLDIVIGLHIDVVPAISLGGDVGTTYQLEYMDALGSVGSWTPLATIAVTNTGQFYLDTSAIGKRGRFYRLVKP